MRDAAFKEWLRKSWPGGPPAWHHSVFQEMYEADRHHLAKARAASAEGQHIAKLERRIAALERALGPELVRRGTLIDTLGALVARQRAETKRAIADEFVRRAPMVHKGIWAPEVEYQAGHVVTHAGAAWAAKIESKGSRPGTDGVWRLIAKGNGS